MRYSFWLSILLLFAACKKPQDRKCFKFNGKESVKELSLGQFDQLDLREHVRYVLIQDSLDKVVLKGGENLLNLIDVSNHSGTIKIVNNNRCSWLRNQKKVVVAEIHFTRLINIKFVGTESLTSVGPIKTDFFAYYSTDGAGDVDLELDALFVSAEADHGWCNYTLRGKTLGARICAKSNGYCDVSNLVVEDSLFVASETAGDIKINADGIAVYGYLRESGNIYYKGTPTAFHIVHSGTGKIAPL